MRKRVSWLALLAIITVLALSRPQSEIAGPAAGGKPDLPTPTGTVQPAPPKPEAGKASIGGVLYSYVLFRPIPETTFYLTQATHAGDEVPFPILLGPRKEMGDVQGSSDESGRFALNNIPPGNYYLLVWAPYSWVPAETSPETHSPLLIRLAADQAEDLGTLLLPWP